MYKKERKSWMKHLDFTILDIICLEKSDCLVQYPYTIIPATMIVA